MSEEAKERGLTVYKSRDGQEIKLSLDTVRKYLVSGKPELVTDQEIMLYMGTCKARGLNPFKKDCYLVKYTQNDAAATIVSIDYFRSRAKAQSDCKGWQSGVIVMTGDDKIEYRTGSFMREGDELLGGWFRAKPAGWEIEYEWSVNLRSFVKKTREGQVTKFWADDNQPQQIAKVAESQGLRRVWPDEFQELSVEGDKLIDVTPSPEPFKDPKPLKVETKKETKQDDKQVATPENSALSKLDAAKAWAETVTPETTSEDLHAHIKGLNQAEQLEVCRIFNARKQVPADGNETASAS